MTCSESSARAIVSDVVAGRRRAEDVAEAAIRRIAERNPALNAIVTFEPGVMMAEAREVDRRRAAGERLPLAGLPVAIKDNIWVSGTRVTQGSELFRDFKAPCDAIVVERLRRAGAVIAGMANTSEFACKGVTTNRLFGPTRHPLDPALTPGGSAGGPAVAVAGGLVPVALGTDGGGSSRRPPGHVGAVGFKPSHGAIPYGPGFAEPFYGISVIAPIARSVDDVAFVFEALRGPDSRDPDSISIEPPDKRTFGELKVAFSPRLGLDRPVDADTAAAIRSAVEKLAAAGLSIEQRDPAWPSGTDESSVMPLQWAGLAALYGEVWKTSPERFDPDVGRQIEGGLALTGAEVARALAISADVARTLSVFFTNVDILLCPTTPCVAWPLTRLGPAKIGGMAVDPRGHAVFTPLFNHAKVPAISIPCGRGRDRLPVGLQISGRRARDLDVLRVAAFAERVLAGSGAPAAVEGR